MKTANMTEYHRQYREENKIKLQGYYQQYREKNRLKLNERCKIAMQKMRVNKIKKDKTMINCVCCGELATNAPNKKYCNNCKSIVKNILRKYEVENIELSVEYSDNEFETNLCDQDCLNCKYDDCILPEED